MCLDRGLSEMPLGCCRGPWSLQPWPVRSHAPLLRQAGWPALQLPCTSESCCVCCRPPLPAAPQTAWHCCASSRPPLLRSSCSRHSRRGRVPWPTAAGGSRRRSMPPFRGCPAGCSRARATPQTAAWAPARPALPQTSTGAALLRWPARKPGQLLPLVLPRTHTALSTRAAPVQSYGRHALLAAECWGQPCRWSPCWH